MKKILFLSFVSIVAFCSCQKEDLLGGGTEDDLYNSPAQIVGYCSNRYDEALGRENEFTGGAAIKLNAAILQDRGDRIIAVRVGLANVGDGIEGDVYISKKLKGNPVYTQHFTTRGTGWEYIRLDTPYLLNGTDSIYLSYQIKAKGYFIGYQTTDVENRDADMVCLNGQWLHLPSAGITGQVCLQVVTEGGDCTEYAACDLAVGTLSYLPYVQSGEVNSVSVVVTNYGCDRVEGFSVVYTDETTESEVSISSALSTGENTKVSFELPDKDAGTYSFKISVKANGGSDLNLENNVIEGVQDVYKESFQRTLLLEQFTGQACMYCPSGGESLRKASMNYRDRIAWVTHHTGYADDNFTLEECKSYLWFYGAGSYAPAVMINRTAVNSSSQKQPVFSAFNLTEEDIATALSEPAYINIDLTVDYNAATRILNIMVQGRALTEFPDARLNIYLVQNGIIAYQENGGANYEHNSAIRALLTDVWGDGFSLDDQQMYQVTYQYYLPTRIGSFDTVADDMYVVAFIADYNPDDFNDCKVHNAAYKYIVEQ